MTITAPVLEAFANAESTENSRWYLGAALLTFLATSEDTGGKFSMLKYYGPKGLEPPRHVHEYEDESFYILDGELTVYVGDKVIKATPGTWATIPRGAEHTFTIDSDFVTMLVMVTPGGFERYFEEMSVPAESLTDAPVSGPPDIERLVAVAEKYGCTFTEPK